jgi:hypothetical protein
MKRQIIFSLLFVLLTSCAQASSLGHNDTSTPIPQPTATFTQTPIAMPSVTPIPTKNPYVVLVQLFTCGDGITDISTNGSPNGLFKPEGIDAYHGHMDVFPPDGCDISKDQMNSPITGIIERYEFYEPDVGGTNWGYHLIFPDEVYPAGIETAFSFAGVVSFKISQVSRVVIDFGHVNCKTGKVVAGEPICTVVPMPAKYGATRIAINIGVVLKDGRGYMFTPTLFEWTGAKWDCHRVPSDSYCEPQPNFYKPGTP